MANRFASVRNSVGLTIYDILPKEWVSGASQCSGLRSMAAKAEELAACTGKTLANTGWFSSLYGLTWQAPDSLRHAIIANGPELGTRERARERVMNPHLMNPANPLHQHAIAA